MWRLALLLGFCVPTLIPLFGQSQLSWMELQKAGDEMNLSEGFVSVVPVFPHSVVELDGAAVEIQGYIIPLDIEGTEYALSAYPNASCFFCGAASPASVMMLNLKDPRHRFSLDQYASFTGTLKLNYQPDGMMYYLEQARLIRK